jgi:hypothetical protein
MPSTPASPTSQPRSTLLEHKLTRLNELRRLIAERDQLEAERLRNLDVFAALGFTPNPGPQSRFLDLPDENIDVLYGGAAGGSKSTSLLLYSLRSCQRYPGLQAFWFRRTFPELEHSVLRMLTRYQHARRLGARWNGSKYELRFPNGSTLTFGHAKSVDEAVALQSAEINLLLLDERTTIPPDVVDMLYTRVRSGVEGVPCLGIRSATNPGGIGHSRVKAEYVDATDQGRQEITDKAQRRRLFIQARTSDTPQLGAQYEASLGGLDEKLRKAFLDGDWNVFAGQAFSSWRYDRHTVEPMPLPASWRRLAGVDWGFAKPWAVVWCAVDEDGRAWLYRELYATQVGEAEQAQRIVSAEAGEQVSVRYADDAMWASRGDAKAISTVYAENGAHLTRAGKGERLIGWQRVRSYLADGPACAHHRAQGWTECPMLHVFQSCSDFIRTLPSVPHATTGNPEDIDTNAEDHMADALRYLLINLGGGASLLLHDDKPETADGLLQPFGLYAVPPELAPNPLAGDGSTQRSPWA